MEVSVLNIKGQETGKKVELNDAIFGIEPNDHVIYLAVKQYLAAQRQGTHKSKERSEIAGSTRKLIRQKGGGGARRGDIKSPVLRGGGRVFGPRPRDYWFKLNKKVKSLARKSALSYKAQQNAIVVVEDFNLDAPKTKAFVEIQKNLNIEGKKLLLVLPGINNNIYLSARNIQRVEVITASSLNTYKVMNANVLVVTEDALKLVDETFNWSLQDDKYFTVSYQLEARRRYQDIHSSFDVAINLLCSIKGEFNSDATVARSECWQNNVQRMFSILHYSCYFLLCEANVIMHDRFQLEIQEYLDIKDTEQLMQNISYTVNLMAQDNANYEAIFDSLILAATKVRSIGNYNNEITVGLHSSMTIPDVLHNN